MLFITRSLAKPGLTRVFAPQDYIKECAALMQIRNYAARKGTRERKQKKKVKVEVKKLEFIAHNQREHEKFLASRPKRKFDDSWRGLPLDNVYVSKYYRWKIYNFIEAVECHRETHHPEMYNKPDANLHITIELNMQGDKPTRFVDNFSRIAAIPHPFDHGEERSVVAFAKTADSQKAALEAGAQMSGGIPLIKQIQDGEISLQDFKFIIAHPDILPDLVQLRGLMKRRFPNPKSGTLDVDVEAVVKKFLHGISYSAKKDEYEKDFGIIETTLGKLDMEPKHLEDNFRNLIKDIYLMKPKREGHFISRCILWSPPSSEKLKVDHDVYLEKPNQQESKEEEVEGERVAL